jgi:DNA-binding transcriptional ArsR family regulator
MPRASTTSDVFNAIAEPRRRQLIDLLAADPSPQPVGRLVRRLRLAQPAVSKHLSVLRRVGLVSMNRHGRQRLYRLNPQELKPVHDWIQNYERFWTQHLDRIKARAERMKQQRQNPTP